MAKPELEQIAATLEQFSFPKKFAVEITAHCNLACTMCHHPTMRRPKGRMPFTLFRRCADQLAAISSQAELWMSFCGEPLLEPELLIRAVEYARTIGLPSVNINTNGMLLVPDVADALLNAGPHLIVIGIDGHSSQVYESIRVGGNRDELYGNIEHVLHRRASRRHQTEIQVQFIEMPENEHELEPFRSYWLKRGASVKIRNKLSWGGQVDTPLCVPIENRIACPWAITMMHVFWDGRVPRCPGDTEGEEGVGNAWDEPIADLWRKLSTYRDLHLQHRFDELPARCHSCHDWMAGKAHRYRPGAPSCGSNDG